MKPMLNRREFFATSATVAAGLTFGLGAQLYSASAAEKRFNTRIYKAVIMNKPTEEGLKKLKDAGFDGVEAGIQPVAEAEQCRATAEKVGMRIHSVLRGWAEFNSADTAKYDASYAKTEDALRAAQAYGAETVLLVPCRIGGMKAPLPWEFRIKFDEQTGHVSKVVTGDNAPYADYIKAQNHATDTSREAVKKLIPLAEKCGVIIALENVWNNLWVDPVFFAHFVRSFQSPWVKAYFDIGNHVKYARPEKWILSLNNLVAKLHAKDFKLNRDDPAGGGKFVNIRDGDVRWPVVRQALDRVGYNGWMTIEGGNCTLAEHSKRLDLIIAGK